MNRKLLSSRSLFATAAFVVSLSLAGSAMAQYHIGEGSDQGQDPSVAGPTVSPDSSPTAPASSGPVRMARFSYISGSVTWRPDPNTEWTTATNNMPLREGAEVWIGDGGRAELQFDDGSYVRFGSGAVATLQTLFSDDQGEFTEIKLKDGLASMELRTDHSVYQIDTPKGAVKSTGPSRVRVGVDEDVEVGVRQGSAVLDGSNGKVTLTTNEYVDIDAQGSDPQVMTLPPEDSWDKFTDERMALMAHQDENLPENQRFIGGDLDQSGTWHQDEEYGKVWTPQEPEDWQPYQNGSWTWCDPFGWTWVGKETWGWLPYHYGSWVHRRWGWSWCPGPTQQYWSPAVVNFSCYGDNVAWTPLAPWECHYPARFGLGVWGGGWSTWFSIGFCGVWFPGGGTYCEARPWNNHFVNHIHEGFERGVLGSHNGFDRGAVGVDVHFRPANAAFGTLTASRDGFASGRYSVLSGERGQEVFTRGSALGAPGRGQHMLSGPAGFAKPGAGSWSSSHSMTSRPEQSGILNRTVNRGSNPFTGARNFSSGAAAAQAARESLGWGRTGSNGGGSNGGGTRPGGFSDGSHPNNSTTGNLSHINGGHTNTSPGSRPHNWSVGQRGGWSHVHSDTRPSGGGSSNSGGGSHGGGGGGGNNGGGGGGRGH